MHLFVCVLMDANYSARYARLKMMILKSCMAVVMCPQFYELGINILMNM